MTKRQKSYPVEFPARGTKGRFLFVPETGELSFECDVPIGYGYERRFLVTNYDIDVRIIDDRMSLVAPAFRNMKACLDLGAQVGTRKAKPAFGIEGTVFPQYSCGERPVFRPSDKSELDYRICNAFAAEIIDKDAAFCLGKQRDDGFDGILDYTTSSMEPVSVSGTVRLSAHMKKRLGDGKPQK